MNGVKMYHNNKEVFPVSIRVGLSRFIDFLNKDSCKKSVITGHNILSYDIPVLLNALNNCEIANSFSDAVIGLCDTLQLFKAAHPGLKSYSQVNLYQHFLEEEYAAHDALQDVVALNRLINHVNPNPEMKQKLTYPFKSFIKRLNFNEEAKIKILSLSPLTDLKAVSKGMCHTIAYSGLAFEHLKLAFNRNGRQGVMDVLTEEVNGKARVTRSKKVVDSISDYFQCKASEI